MAILQYKIKNLKSEKKKQEEKSQGECVKNTEEGTWSSQFGKIQSFTRIIILMGYNNTLNKTRNPWIQNISTKKGGGSSNRRIPGNRYRRNHRVIT